MSLSLLHALLLAGLCFTRHGESTCDKPPVLHGSASLATDHNAYFTTQVTINGAGPFPFIVDTGAQSSNVKKKTATQLGLRSIGSVHAIAGTGTTSSVVVMLDRFASGVFDRRNEPMMLIEHPTDFDADGILGMNAFVSGRIELDFARHLLVVGPSSQAPAGFAVQHGTVRLGNFMIVDATIDGIHATAVIDTGARYTIGNLKLLAALGLKPNDARLLAPGSVSSIGAEHITASRAALGNIVIGTTSFRDPKVTFADLPLFPAEGLDEGPALIIGVDQLSQLEAMAIDYPREELQLLP